MGRGENSQLGHVGLSEQHSSREFLGNFVLCEVNVLPHSSIEEDLLEEGSVAPPSLGSHFCICLGYVTCYVMQSNNMKAQGHLVAYFYLLFHVQTY